jgi:hypothetical protein
MILTTLGQLVDAELTGALNRLSALRLGVKPAYHIHRLVGLVRAELKTYEDRRLELVRQHGIERAATPDERRQGAHATMTEVPMGTDAFDAFTRDIVELKSIDVTIHWRPIRLNDLGDSVVMPSDLTRLGPLVTCEDEDEQDTRA